MKSTTQNIKAIRLQFGDLTITAEVEARLEELGFTPETLIDAIGEHKSDCSACLVGFILGTTNPLTIGISAENQWVCLFSCQSC